MPVYIATHKLSQGGAEVAAINLASALLDQGVAVNLVCIKNEEDIDRINGVEVDSPKYSKRKIIYLVRVIFFLVKLVFQLRKDDSKLVSFQTDLNCLLLSIGIILRRSSRICVCERSDPYLYPSNKILRLVRERLYPYASLVIAQTKHAERFFQNSRSDINVRVCPNICNFKVQSPKLNVKRADSSAIALLIVGRLVESKRIEYAIEVVIVAELLGQPVSLTIVGEGPMRSDLEMYCRSKGVSERVNFVGYKNDLCSFYSEADLLLCPSELEGLSNVIVEGLAFGLPCVVDENCRPNAEVVLDQKTGFLVSNFRDKDSWARIFKLVGDFQRYSTMRRACRSTYQYYSKQNAGKVWLDAIMEIGVC